MVFGLLMSSCVNQQKCDKLSGSGVKELLQHFVSARRAPLHNPVCAKNAHSSLCRESHPPSEHSTKSECSYWILLVSPDPPIHQSLAIHTPPPPVPSVTKTLHLKNVSRWQIEPTHAIWIRNNWSNGTKTPKLQKPVLRSLQNQLLSFQLLFPSWKFFCKSETYLQLIPMNLIRLNTVFANNWLKLDFSNNLNLICSELVHVSNWYVVM